MTTGFDGRISGLLWLPARYPGRLFTCPPDLLVVHSAATGDDPAGYLATMPDGRIASAHISARSRDGDYVQQVSLLQEAWHAGGSTCQGDGRVNARSIGVELPAHAGPRLVSATVAMLHEVCLVVPTLAFWTAHRFIRASKRDPVCLDDDQLRDMMAGLPLMECR